MDFDCTKILKIDKTEIEGRKIVSKRDPPGQKSVYMRPGTEIEGRKIVSKRDPPGQKSVYIRPGI